MLNLYVYKEFELQGMISQYTSIKWVRRYNDVGQCEIELPFDKEIFSLLEIDNVLYHKNTKEACFVVKKEVTTDSYGNEKIIVSGKSISSILKNRIASYTGTATIKDIIDSLLNNNFIKAVNTKRNISNFAIKSTSLHNNQPISVKYENTDVYTIVAQIAQQHNVGFKVNYDIESKKYLFELYEGQVKTDVMFSSSFNNVLEQEYYLSADEYKNTCIVADNEGITTTVNDTNEGITRKEVYTSLSTDSTDTATRQGELIIQSLRIEENMDTVIDTNSIQFSYLDDWNLGDIVTTINKKLGVTIQKNIMEIEEFYDTSGLNLAVTFGEIKTNIANFAVSGSGSGSITGGGKDGYTPIKGIDYFDGKDGKDGKDGISSSSNLNLLINGDFIDWTRGTSFPQDHNNYTTSRWYATQTGMITRQVNTSPAPTLYHARIMCSSNQAYNIYAQPLENNQIYFNQELTVSFWARGIGGLNSIRVWILKNNLTINLTSTWKKFTFTTTPTGVLSGGAHEQGVKFDTVIMADATKGYEINLVKLEFGGVDTPFVPRLIGEEIMLGKRYYLPTQDLVTSSFTMMATQPSLLQGSISFPTTMRVSPTPSFPFHARKIKTGEVCTITNGAFLITENGFNTIHQITTDIPLTAGEWYSMDMSFDAEIY